MTLSDVAERAVTPIVLCSEGQSHAAYWPCIVCGGLPTITCVWSMTDTRPNVTGQRTDRAPLCGECLVELARQHERFARQVARRLMAEIANLVEAR